MVDRVLGRIARWPDRRWVTVGSLLAVTVGAGLALSVLLLKGAGIAGTGVAAVVGTLATGWAVLVLYLLLEERSRSQQVRALANVRPLTGGLPLGLGDWAADPTFADALVRMLCLRRPEQVVECGSGWTTVLMAACLEELGRGRLVALEHHEGYARRTRDLLVAVGVADRADVLVAPLELQQVGGERRPWYAERALDALEAPIDVLVVDGPPGPAGEEIRYPAVPLLMDRLAEGATVILDDGFRRDEARIARAWGSLLGMEAKLDPRGSGFWVLDRSGDEAEDPVRGAQGA